MTTRDAELIRNAIQAAVLEALRDLNRRFGEKPALGPALAFSKEEKLNDSLILVSRAAGNAAAAVLSDPTG